NGSMPNADDCSPPFVSSCKPIARPDGKARKPIQHLLLSMETDKPFVVDVLEAVDLQRAELERLPLLRRMRDGRCGRSVYCAFLADLYHVVWHFCPTMAAA